MNILYDERPDRERAKSRATYLLNRLDELKTKYPKLIQDVRGHGLMLGLEFQRHQPGTAVRPQAGRCRVLDDKLKGSLWPPSSGRLLLRDYDMLVAFTEYNRNVIRLEPPLICERTHCDAVVDALDDLLGRGLVRIVADFIKSYASGS